MLVAFVVVLDVWFLLVLIEVGVVGGSWLGDVLCGVGCWLVWVCF